MEIVVSAVALPSGCELTFHVRDTGLGIPPDRLERLFKPFSQVDSSITRNYGGTGLGLAISQRLVALMHGKIAVASEPGKGSDFHFTLPVQAAQAADVAPVRPPLSSGEIETVLRGRRVLVVDDYPANRRLFEKVFGQFGATVVAASSATEGLTALTGAHFDLIILDYMMPVMDGITLAKKISSTGPGKHPPMMLVTSVVLAQGENVPGLFAATVAKPIRNWQFATTAARVLLGQTAPARDEAKTPPPAEKAPPFGSLHPLRILAVDDNPVNLKVISITLTTLGYAPVVTDNAATALERLRSEKFDLVLMDVQMPEMDGHEATRRLRRGDAGAFNQHVRVLALTAGAMAEEQQACRDAGMDDFIAKPLSRTVLLQKLKEAFDGLKSAGLKAV